MISSMKERFLVEWFLFKKNWFYMFLFPILMIYLSVILLRNLIFYYANATTQRFWDIGFRGIPEYADDYIENLVQWVVWGSTSFYLFLPGIFPRFHQKKKFGIPRFIVTYTILLFLHSVRVISYHVTRIDSPSDYCMNLNESDKPQTILGKYILSRHYNGGNNNLIYFHLKL